MNDFLCDVFWVELCSEPELKWRLFLDVLTEDFFVEFEPSGVVLRVSVLKTEEPDLTETNGFYNLQDEFIRKFLVSYLARSPSIGIWRNKKF